jgi:hypothetical protein
MRLRVYTLALSQHRTNVPSASFGDSGIEKERGIMASVAVVAPVVDARPGRVVVSVGLLLSIVTVALVAACGVTTSRPPEIAFESLPVRAAPQAMAGMKLPRTPDAVTLMSASLPPVVAGRSRLSTPTMVRSGSLDALYGEERAATGQPSIRLTVLDVSKAYPPGNLTNSVDRLIADARVQADRSIPITYGRDGDIVWYQTATLGYTLEWAQIGQPWLYVVTAGTEAQMNAMVAALGQTVGWHGGGSVIRR